MALSLKIRLIICVALFLILFLVISSMEQDEKLSESDQRLMSIVLPVLFSSLLFAVTSPRFKKVRGILAPKEDEESERELEREEYIKEKARLRAREEHKRNRRPPKSLRDFW